MVITSEINQIKSCQSSRYIIIDLKKEITKNFLASLLQSIEVAADGRSRPLVLVLEEPKEGGLCALLLRPVTVATGGHSSPMDFVWEKFDF